MRSAPSWSMIRRITGSLGEPAKDWMDEDVFAEFRGELARIISYEAGLRKICMSFNPIIILSVIQFFLLKGNVPNFLSCFFPAIMTFLKAWRLKTTP